MMNVPVTVYEKIGFKFWWFTPKLKYFYNFGLGGWIFTKLSTSILGYGVNSQTQYEWPWIRGQGHRWPWNVRFLIILISLSFHGRILKLRSNVVCSKVTSNIYEEWPWGNIRSKVKVIYRKFVKQCILR